MTKSPKAAQPPVGFPNRSPVDPYEYIWRPDEFLGSGIYLVRARAGGEGGNLPIRISQAIFILPETKTTIWVEN